MFCTNCGVKNAESTKFCASCGAANIQTTAEPAQAQTYGATPTSAYPGGGKGKNKAWLPIVACVVGLAIVVGAFWLLTDILPRSNTQDNVQGSSDRDNDVSASTTSRDRDEEDNVGVSTRASRAARAADESDVRTVMMAGSVVGMTLSPPGTPRVLARPEWNSADDIAQSINNEFTGGVNIQPGQYLY